MKNVLEYLERSARLYPDKTAFEDLNQKITYAQLEKRAKGHRQRIGRKTCAAFADRRVYGKKASIRSQLLFGIAYAGCFYVMMDLRHPKARIDHILATLEGHTVISVHSYDKQLERLELKEQTVYLERGWREISMKQNCNRFAAGIWTSIRCMASLHPVRPDSRKACSSAIAASSILSMYLQRHSRFAQTKSSAIRHRGISMCR